MEQLQKAKLKDILKQYRDTHLIKDDKEYSQVTISQEGKVYVRGKKKGSEIGRKRQFFINLKKYPNTLIFIRQGIYKGGIGLAPPEMDGCTVTENMPMFEVVNINPKFLIYYFKTRQFKRDLDKLVPLGTAQKALHERKLLKLDIPLPSKQKQEKIVKVLDNFFENNKKIDDINLENLSLIQKLRQVILQEAVQGKLVPQDPNDEPASKLLKKIKADKEILIKGKKFRKEKPLGPISNDEIFYKIPSSWIWCRLGDIGVINPSNNCEDELEVSFIPMNLISSKYGITPKYDVKKWREVKKGFTHFAEKDVVVAKITPCFENSKAGVMKNLRSKIGAGTTELHVFRGDTNLILPEYVYIYFKSPIFLKTGKQKMTGTAGQQRVPKDFITKNPFPLPPFAEQKRIVEKVDKFMEFCDGLEKQIKVADINNNNLINAVLRETLHI